LIVTDHDRGVFAVEGPMTDDKHWQDTGPRGSQSPASHHLRAGQPRSRRAGSRLSRRAPARRRSARQHREVAAMNDPAFIAEVASGVGGRSSGRPCFPMPCRAFGRCHGGDGTRSVAVARGLRLIALSPHSPVPAVVGGQTFGDQMVACAAALGDQGCRQNVFCPAPRRLEQRILPTVPPRGLTRGRDR